MGRPPPSSHSQPPTNLRPTRLSLHISEVRRDSRDCRWDQLQLWQGLGWGHRDDRVMAEWCGVVRWGGVVCVTVGQGVIVGSERICQAEGSS